MMKHARTLRLVLMLSAVVLIAPPAFAGPPILYHPFDIGNARSLPWSTSPVWYQGDSKYDIRNVVADTEALLTPPMPVIVRMETIRRAAVYASLDTAVASQLLNRLRARTTQPGAERDALAWFDAAYLTGIFKQMLLIASEPPLRERAEHLRQLTGLDDSMRLVQKAIALRRPIAAP